MKERKIYVLLAILLANLHYMGNSGMCLVINHIGGRDISVRESESLERYLRYYTHKSMMENNLKNGAYMFRRGRKLPRIIWLCKRIVVEFIKDKMK